MSQPPLKKYILKKTAAVETPAPQNAYQNELNPAQFEAVNHLEGPALVIAGAGSGKTRTLIYRVARLVNRGVSPESILLLTFTRKSAQEMLRRAAILGDSRCQNVAGGTFHSFANLVLRKFAKYLGYTDQFTIMDRSDSEDLINHVRRELNLNLTDKRFPQKGTLLAILSRALNTARPIADVILEDYPQYNDLTPLVEKIRDQYQATKFKMQVMDYDDLLTQLRALLCDHEIVCEQLQRQFRYLMVDEYQDTNTIQADLIALLAGEHRNVMVVGDDSQSIYAFRGANFKNILDFPTLFPGAKIITLEENYRSTQPILDITNAIIANATEKYPKKLFTQVAGGDRPVYVETESENDQSRFLCQKILELREEGIPLNQMAVLFRSGWQSNDLEVELKVSHIPFVKFGGFKFVETAHVKDVIAGVRVLHNRQDIISWQRFLTLLEGIGPKAAADIFELVQHHTGRYTEIALDKFQKKSGFVHLKSLFKTLDRLSRPECTPAEIVRQLIDYYKPVFKTRYDDHVKRQADLDSLITISERFQTLEQMLTEMSLEPPESSQSDALPELEDEEKLVLSTIHSAKGLEWHTVFIISLVDGYLPSFQSLNTPASIEEERRLLYVAMTRARQNLFLIKPNLDHGSGQYYRHPGMQFSKVSRFLSENNLLDCYAEKWALVDEHDPMEAAFFRDPDPDDDFPNYDPNSKKYYFGPDL